MDAQAMAGTIWLEKNQKELNPRESTMRNR